MPYTKEQNAAAGLFNRASIDELRALRVLINQCLVVSEGAQIIGTKMHLTEDFETDLPALQERAQTLVTLLGELGVAGAKLNTLLTESPKHLGAILSA